MTRTVATRCQILRQNCTKLDFGWGSDPKPLGELYFNYSTLQSTYLDLRGPTSQGRQGMEGEGDGCPLSTFLNMPLKDSG